MTFTFRRNTTVVLSLKIFNIQNNCAHFKYHMNIFEQKDWMAVASLLLNHEKVYRSAYFLPRLLKLVVWNDKTQELGVGQGLSLGTSRSVPKYMGT